MMDIKQKDGNEIDMDNNPVEIIEESAPPVANGTTPNRDAQRIMALIIGSVLLIVGLVVGLVVGLAGRSKNKDLPNAPTFSVSLASIGPETLENPYTSCDNLRQDLVEAAKYLANSKIDADARWYYHVAGPIEEAQPIATDASNGNSNKGVQPPVSAPPPPQEGGEDSYLTNNQVVGVDEVDIVKSNGDLVFAAYGRDVVVMDHADNVTVLSRTSIPFIEIKGVDMDIDVESTETSFSGDGFSCSSSVSGLLLHDDRLVVLATGSCYYWGPLWKKNTQDRVLSDSESTRVFVYSISSTDGSLSLVGDRVIPGYLVSARSIESNVHVVTTSHVNAHYTFTQYFDRWSNSDFDDLLENQYRTSAHEEAGRRVESFVDVLLTELRTFTNDDTCSSLLPVALLQSTDLNSTESSTQLEFTGNGVLSTLNLVSSFDMQSDLGADFATSVSGMFHPTASSTVYASKEYLVLAGQGWHEDTRGQWHEETFLTTYELNGASARVSSFGKLPGTIINQFALDYTEKDGVDYLRVATTTSAHWGIVSESPRTWGQTVESSSQVSVLTNDVEAKTMTLVGKVTDLGKTERIYSVRFLGDRAFVVTFRQVDPLYSIDLSDPTNPEMVGELKIPGFSNYLHPVGDDYLLGVGQNADEETGRTSGLQISLFDVSDLADPKRLQHYVATSVDGSYSYSDAQYEHKAFRYLPDSKVLILPVQIYSYDSPQNFDGFYIYDVDPEAGISPRFQIEHADAYEIRYGCWSRSYIQARSLVFDSDIMTLKGHSVSSHDLSTGDMETTLNLDAGLQSGECQFYFLD